MSLRESLIGRRFGRLVVTALDRVGSHQGMYWRCRCDCGREVARASGVLTAGRLGSCGCGRRGRRPGPSPPSPRNAEVARRYAAGGVSIRELAAEYGVSAQRISQIIGPVRPSPPSPRNAEVARRYAAGGVSIRELAAEYGLSERWVRQLVRRARVVDAVLGKS